MYERILLVRGNRIDNISIRVEKVERWYIGWWEIEGVPI